MRISVRNLHKRFDELIVFNGLSVEIEPHKVTAIIGGSGQGKSVLLKHLIGLLRPDSGEILIDGANIVNMKESDLLPIRRRFGMIFQSGALLTSMTVADNVALGLREHRMAGRAKVNQIVEEKLALVHLNGRGGAMPSELSGGKRKRAAIARALTMEPEIILYDEPTAGLDPPMADNVDDMIVELNERLGITSVVVTHDMASVFKIADFVYMLHNGRVVQKGSPDEIRSSENETVRNFIARELRAFT